jgi:hypothetical protein
MPTNSKEQLGIHCVMCGGCSDQCSCFVQRILLNSFALQQGGGLLPGLLCPCWPAPNCDSPQPHAGRLQALGTPSVRWMSTRCEISLNELDAR